MRDLVMSQPICCVGSYCSTRLKMSAIIDLIFRFVSLRRVREILDDQDVCADVRVNILPLLQLNIATSVLVVCFVEQFRCQFTAE